MADQSSITHEDREAAEKLVKCIDYSLLNGGERRLDEYSCGLVKIGFEGGLAFERERAKGLVEALEDLKRFAKNCRDEYPVLGYVFDGAEKALAKYRGEK